MECSVSVCISLLRDSCTFPVGAVAGLGAVVAQTARCEFRGDDGAHKPRDCRGRVGDAYAASQHGDQYVQ